MQLHRPDQRGKIATRPGVNLHPDDTVAIQTKQNSYAFSYFTVFCRLSAAATTTTSLYLLRG